MTDIEYIAANVSDEDLLCQIAEECAELAHAALKLRRAMRKTNPTPKSRKEAQEAFLEEIGDIRATLAVLLVGKVGSSERETVVGTTNKKLTRWRIRLEDRDEGELACGGAV